MTDLISLPLLKTTLEQGLKGSAHIYIALSGGVDSIVLLDLVYKTFIENHFDLTQLSVIYINHQLQAQADTWQIFCQKSAEKYQLNFISETIQTQPAPGESIENFARTHRYRLFFKHVRAKKDMLLLAHHLDDQAETVLFRLIKGAGPKGLSGISNLYHYQGRFIYRPLLFTSKQTILNYAEKTQLRYINDPTNDLVDYDRNFLRKIILPLLSSRFGRINHAITRSARHYQQQQQALDYFIEQELNQLKTDHVSQYYCLSLTLFCTYPNYIQANLLRKWLELHGCKAPSEKKLAEILHQICTAKTDKTPTISWGEKNQYTIRRFQDKIFINKKKPNPRELSKNKLDIHFRKPGQRIYFLNKSHSVSLKKFLQNLGVPPWDRNKVPLYFYQEKYLVEVEGYWKQVF